VVPGIGLHGVIGGIIGIVRKASHKNTHRVVGILGGNEALPWRWHAGQIEHVLLVGQAVELDPEIDGYLIREGIGGDRQVIHFIIDPVEIQRFAEGGHGLVVGGDGDVHRGHVGVVLLI